MRLLRQTKENRPVDCRLIAVGFIGFVWYSSIFAVLDISILESALTAIAASLTTESSTESESIKIKQKRRRRRRRLDEAILNDDDNDDIRRIKASATVPLHATSGTHHVQVYIGSPPQRQTLIVDTGSRLMAFPCLPCDSCGKHVSRQYFDPYQSTTDRTPACKSDTDGCLLKGISKCHTDGYDENRCVITQKYTEGSSWTAHEKEDVVWLGSSAKEQSYEEFMDLAIPYIFGCQTTVKGLFKKQYADGILGMAIHETSIVAALYKENAIRRHAFSMCLTRTTGTLGLGGISSTSLHQEPMAFSPIIRDHGWFALKVWSVRLGGVCVACPNSPLLDSFDGGKGTILDSGTTDSYLPEHIAPVFQEVWTELTGLDYANRKRKYTFTQFKSLPDIEFTFEGNLTLTVPPFNYMEGVPNETWTGKKELVNRMYLDEPEGAVLGANVMFGHDILFDTQARRVGIAKARCDLQTTGVHSFRMT